jgi:hypothetical protein
MKFTKSRFMFYSCLHELGQADCSDHVFYVGTTVHKQNTAGYCNEALACLLDTKRRPVLFPKDSDRFSMTQVLNDLSFQVLHLPHRSQYMEVRMLETCIHTVMHHMPGRMWFLRGAGPYLSKLEDVQRQMWPPNPKKTRNLSHCKPK